MLKRKIEKDIGHWIESSDKALLIYGVRQSGKTFIIRHCLEKAGCNYIEFNLIRQPEIISILGSAANTDDLILKLSLYSTQQIIPGKTIFFFDEIQKYKEIVTRIKFLVEDKRFRYILSGSLLGIELVNLKSAPVGYLQTAAMYPLDFEEFLYAINISGSVIDSLHQSYELTTPVDDIIHKRMLEIFNLYLIIGGMPAAVAKYIETSNIDEVMNEHTAIIEQYKLDFTQYEADNRKLIISRIYELIPAELNEPNKRFKIGDIQKDLRYDRITDSFTWLWKAGVALGVFNVTEPSVPLMLNEKSSLFKLFLSDVGLLTSMYGKACKLKIVSNEGDMNKGAVYENVIAQELCAHGYPLYYYNSKKYGELDFVIEHMGQALPIEVKSGKNYTKHSALNNILRTKEYNVESAYVLSNDNIKVVGGLVYLPIYMIMFLHPDNISFADISVDRYRL